MWKIIVGQSNFDEIIHVNDIIHIKGFGSYSEIYLKEDITITVSKNLHWFESKLPEHSFFRPHKSHILNMNSITKICKTDGGYICLSNGKSVPISRNKKNELMDRMICFCAMVSTN